MPHRTAGCGKSSLRPLMAGSSPSLPDGSNPSAAIVQSASDVQCSRLLKTTMGLSTSFVTPLKKVSQMHCPWSLEQYGGVEHFSPLLGPRAEPVDKPGNCWPGGHAAAGFALFALFFALRNTHPRCAKAALIAAMTLGVVFSLVRIAQGAHFLSHNLWTASLCWLISLAVYDLMLYRPSSELATDLIAFTN